MVMYRLPGSGGSKTHRGHQLLHPTIYYPDRQLTGERQEPRETDELASGRAVLGVEPREQDLVLLLERRRTLGEVRLGDDVFDGLV